MVTGNSTYFIRSIQNAIDKSMSTFYEWYEKLQVKCLHEGDQDIMMLTNPNLGLVPSNANFSVSKFPVDSGYKGSGFQSLKNYLQVTAIDSGCNMV